MYVEGSIKTTSSYGIYAKSIVTCGSATNLTDITCVYVHTIDLYGTTNTNAIKTFYIYSNNASNGIYADTVSIK